MSLKSAGKPSRAGDEVVLQNMAAIRAGVEQEFARGIELSALAVIIRERSGKVVVEVVPRKAVRVKGPNPDFIAAVERVAKDGRNRLPILIALPVTRSVLWFDYEAFQRTGSLALAAASEASHRRSN